MKKMHNLILFLLVLVGCKPAVELNGDTGIDKFSFEKEAAIGLAYTFTISPDVSVNTFIIQNKDSLPQETDVTKLKAKFSTINTLVKVKVNGVEQTSNVTVNDFTNPVIYEAYAEDGTVKKYKVIVNVAKQSLQAEKFIFINQTIFTDAEAQAISTKYGSQSNKRIAVGLGVIISMLRTAPNSYLADLNNQLALSKKYDLPILIKLDAEIWWQYRSDLWNWWDISKAGYNVNNKNNVEWYDWTPDAALKIAWLNWGQQIRTLPPPNLMSIAYITAWKDELTKAVNVIKTWADGLTPDKKFLFGGIVLGWESSIGVSNFYYPNGNDYLNQPTANDPTYGRSITTLPSRGVQTIGYAAVKTAGIASSGVLTQEMQTEVVRRHLENQSKTVNEMGIPRTRIFTHCGGWAAGETIYQAAINNYSCPGWSYYKDAADPTRDLTAMAALTKSDAPYWGAVEWLLQGSNKTQADWVDALNKSIANKSRLVCIYNWGSINSNLAALEAIKSINK
jgi:hypothetical protein